MTNPRLRIGLIKQFYEGDAVHPEVAAVLQEFALQLQRLGHAVEEASIDFTTHEVVFPVMQGVATGTALFLDQLAASRGRAIDPGEVEPVVWSAYQHARSVKAPTIWPRSTPFTAWAGAWPCSMNASTCC